MSTNNIWDHNLNQNIADGAIYEQDSNIAVPKGANESKLKSGTITNSVINKLHLIKINGNFPAMESDIPKHKGFFEPKTLADLCRLDTCAQQYDIEDFLYVSEIGLPINRLITLRRFPYPCTDNIYEKETQGEPDIARMVSYSTHTSNKLDDLLSFSYSMKWKSLTAEFEEHKMEGDRSGVSGAIKKIAEFLDPTMQSNAVSGRTSGGPMSQYDPKFDDNKVYGPVDSMTETHIRDVGFNFSKEFDIQFNYEMRSVGGRTPEYAFKDLLANVLACTYNNGKFWGGARYWIGERPTNFGKQIAYMNSDDIDGILTRASESLKTGLNQFFGNSETAKETLKKAVKGGFAMALGKILDTVGRPGILVSNSLLGAEPTGYWHLTIGNPVNPIMCIGNLIIDNVEYKFPSDSLSYGGFPTKMQVNIKLKPAQPKDRAGIEMMFNRGIERIYYAPKTVTKSESKAAISKQARGFFGFDTSDVDRMLDQSYDFIADGVKSVTKTTTTNSNIVTDNQQTSTPTSNNLNTLSSNNELT